MLVYSKWLRPVDSDRSMPAAAVYGDIPDKLPIDESNGYNGKSPYAETKWAVICPKHDVILKQTSYA